ncbi:MAG: SufB/SufD family protein [Rhabdochlamydiaceae bacterium]
MKKQLECLASERLNQDVFKDWRQKFWEKFLSLGLPDKKQEEFRYVALKNLYQSGLSSCFSLDKITVDAHILSFCQDNVLVFIDGRYAPGFSCTKHLPLKVVSKNLKDAFRSYKSFIEKKWKKDLEEEKDPFYTLNMSLFEEGYFLFIPPHTSISKPLQILHLTTGEICFPKLELILGEEAHLKVVSKQVSLSSSFVHMNIGVSLEKQSSCEWTFMEENVLESYCFLHMAAFLKEGAQFKQVMTSLRPHGNRHKIKVSLLETEARAWAGGLYLGDGKDRLSTHVNMFHLAPHTYSTQLFKGVLNKTSHSHFRGEIYVAPEALKTEAYQLNNQLLLGQGAVAISQPNLQILADDVKASHGATISQLNQEQLFYLQSRGLSPHEAVLILLRGYCDEVLENSFCHAELLRNMTALDNYIKCI